MNTEPVFVYGTLRMGASNHYRMAAADFIGVCKTKGRIYGIGWYPALICGGDGEVAGELYHASPGTLAALDQFEGITAEASGRCEYRRVKASVEMDDGGNREAWMWEWAEELNAALPIAGGDWLAFEPNPT